ncbi:NAD+ synthase [Oxynema aestuarii]|jgi:NAD+ synthase (glutamine-hydrolysing)|uniref:Glutamine-dependent NAD(+) synthetase n=1 Tax=Oxynema aestuarii AP17 TaxID=2064643 RepID=A0A6H1U4I5_9CYAN|nr:NAD+ synthase [Oxynema aestuarii]QIZ73336.1 NAD+ synthase [Oxynema aestuarii AP17]RMH71735.1 MAG: NAD+ synthase [Cyanobacteria bacterium J007]
MKIAIAQLNPTIGDLTGNAQRILNRAYKAADAGVRLLLTPELSLCGYPPRDLLLRPSFIEAMSDQLHELARQLPPNIAVLVGTVDPNPGNAIDGGKPLFNSIALLDNRQVCQFFHKRLLPTYDVFDEHRYFEPASNSNFFTLDGSSIKIGVTICEDLWNDEEFWGKRSYSCNPIADLVQAKVDLIVNLSASPYTVGKQELREAMLRHSALRYQIPIIYTNQIGGNDDLIFDGSSVAFSRSGELLCRAKAFAKDGVALHFNETNKDLEAIAPSDGLHTAIEPLKSKNEAIWSALVLGVHDYARKCGFGKVVIGLSGGIDSSLVAAIATAALGAENVLGILMPSPHSSPHSIADAVDLAKNLGIQTHQLPIAEMMETYDRSLSELFAGMSPDVTEENLQSRIRGNLLMAIANKFGHLLLSTGNKSEMAVGYCTLYGDMNGGLAVISDVPKTRVYAICKWLNEREKQAGRGEMIPGNVLIKPPSAELKPDQKDEDSLPPYEILDDILYRAIENHESPVEIVAAGHDPATVERVVQLLTRAEFKRRQAPPGLKVTDRAFGTGWRMPIAARLRHIVKNPQEHKSPVTLHAAP